MASERVKGRTLAAGDAVLDGHDGGREMGMRGMSGSETGSEGGPAIEIGTGFMSSPDLHGGAEGPRTKLDTPSALNVKRMARIFLFCAFTMMCGQNLMNPSLTKVSEEFGLTPTERDIILGGYMNASFYLLGGAMTIVVGYLVDKMQRKLLFEIVALVGFSSLGANAFVHSVWYLLPLRAVYGAVVGGLSVLLYSLFGDLYPPSERGAMSSMVVVCVGAGLVVGQLIAGFFASYVTWRQLHLMVAALGYCVVVVVHMFAIEPTRGAADVAVRGSTPTTPQALLKTKLDSGVVWGLLQIRTNTLSLVQAIPGTLPWGVLTVFLSDYLSTERGFTIQQATTAFGGFGAGGAIGGSTGGFMGQLAYNKKRAYLPLFTGAAQILGCIPVLYLMSLRGDTTSTGFMAFLGFCAGFLTSIPSPNIKAMLLNVNTPNTRGAIFTIMYLFDSFGKGTGPYIVGQMLRIFPSRQAVFSVAVLGWALSGCFSITAALSLEADAAKALVRASNRD